MDVQWDGMSVYMILRTVIPKTSLNAATVSVHALCTCTYVHNVGMSRQKEQRIVYLLLLCSDF